MKLRFLICTAAVLAVGSQFRAAAGEVTPGRAWGLVGMYFNLPAQVRNVPMMPEFAPAFVRVDPNVDFDWTKQAPVPRVGNSDFGVRWVGYLRVERAGVHTFRLTYDRGVRLKVDKELVYEGTRRPAQGARIDVNLSDAGWVPFEAQFHAYRSRRPKIRIEWAEPGKTGFEPIPAGRFAHDTAVGTAVRKRGSK